MTPGGQFPAQSQPADMSGEIIVADGAALFRPGGAPDADPLVKAGTQVAQGQLLGTLQVGAAMLPIHSPAAGQITAVLAAEGALVGYGTPLFRLENQY
ncbi:MAG: acetyl-CoA carboxylase biotin carboxyl carrier protein [Pseudorhodobacter sp.]